MNVIFKDPCKFVQKGTLHNYTCPKSRSNEEKQDKLLQHFPIQVNKQYGIIHNKTEQLCLKPSKIGKTSKFLYN